MKLEPHRQPAAVAASERVPAGSAPGRAVAPSAADEAYQVRILQDVSRTFALTIPQLPPVLARVVSNAYLLCRIADTIEDEPGLGAGDKRRFAERFVRVVEGEASAERFAAELAPRLTGHTLEAERDLVRNTPCVLRITHSCNPTQLAALQRCVRIMSQGMAQFQQNKRLDGLEDVEELGRYCYHVAGVVGEMLTELFCDYSPPMRAHRETLLRLAVSFGQGLQMTNILKDLWDDRRRGACWLPRDVFRAHGFDLRELTPGRYDEAFGEGLRELIGIARLHLANALTYTLMFPRDETGIRRFCLWALGMAVLTLRKVHRHLDFTAGEQVKIARRSVKATVVVSNLTVRQDAILRALFAFWTRGLPLPAGREAIVLAS